MLRAEIIRSCSHEKVADAAVLSIGSDFHKRLELLAGATGQTPGSYASEIVRRFAREALEEDWEALSDAIAGCDMPILCGLRWIVETTIEADRVNARGGGRGRASRSRAHGESAAGDRFAVQ